jgi:phosphonoacetaldehyde hydrolase
VRRIEAVIFDWAGTTVDHGSVAPVRGVSEVFRNRGVEVTDAEVRRDMGIYKRDHIRNLLADPAVGARWRERFGRAATDADVESLFQDFIPTQSRVLERFSTLIPGVLDTAGYLRSRGIRIGSTTGYTRPMLDIVVACARRQGYCPELSYCPDDVGGGRPLPWMCWRIAMEFGLRSAANAVKVGDTPSDIEEARNAGMWAVGVTTTGNEVGLSAQDWAALSHTERAQRAAAASKRLRDAGAHYVIAGVSELRALIEETDGLLANGARP